MKRLAPLALALFFLAEFTACGQTGVDFFESKIRPVLVEHCYKCHSTDAKKTKGGLLLDSKAAMLRGGDSGPALVPGKPRESLLIKAIGYDDPELRMPPKGKMPAEIRADFEKWVAMGAPDPRIGEDKVARGSPSIEEGRKFWSFRPVKKPALPDVKDARWVKDAIDRFVLAKLEGQGLAPGRDAEPLTLLRRLHFALIGLPPTIEEQDAFVREFEKNAQSAIEKLVDRLLESPHFGERWGRHWLDVARYADSSGGGRSLLFKDSWRYRDYVIAAFNDDKPFDRFILEQIAGDLLNAKSVEERRTLLIATAFLLLGPTNYERQDKPVLEMDIIDEQLDTVGRAFLGMTLGCARCHDHKFDPIPTRDYYAMAGILKSTKMIVHSNVSRWMEVPLPALAHEAPAVKKHDAQVAALQSELARLKAEEVKSGKTPVASGTVDPRSLPGIVVDDEDAKKVGPWKQSTFTGNFVGKGYHYDDRAAKIEKTLTFQPDFAKGGMYEVRLAYVPHDNRASNIAVRIFHTDGDDTVHVNQKKTPPIAGRWVSLGKYRFAKGSQWFVMVSTDGANGHVTADAVQFLPESTVDAKPVPVVKGQRTSQDVEAELKRLIASGPEKALAMAVNDAARSEDCHICVRGNFHSKGDVVPRGVLSVMPTKAGAIKANESGRRQLAEWLASPDNPLTARVTVNRIWHHLFGTGLVRTVDNFGAMGEAPSHPELLDYLAGRFVEDGWSMKKMIREIVLSHTYRLGSDPHPAAEKVDPENRLLARHSRRRLDAECLRDGVLLASGKLDRTTGGPAFAKTLTTERNHTFTDTRRSVYTAVLRNNMLELFEMFDFADPNVSTGRRNVSTVSTQALYLMNSPFIHDQAAVAAKVLETVNLEDAARLDVAYRRALGRLPTERERDLALRFLRAAPERSRAWEDVYQVLFASVDFRYVR